jgi:hypothetical protein
MATPTQWRCWCGCWELAELFAAVQDARIELQFVERVLQELPPGRAEMRGLARVSRVGSPRTVPTASAARAAALVSGADAADGVTLLRARWVSGLKYKKTASKQMDYVRPPQVQQQPTVNASPRGSMLWLVLVGLLCWAIVIRVAVSVAQWL